MKSASILVGQEGRIGERKVVKSLLWPLVRSEVRRGFTNRASELFLRRANDLQESVRTRNAFEDFVELADEPVKEGGDLADRVAGSGLR